MSTKTTLCALAEGQTATVTQLHLQGGMRRRLQDLGIAPEATILCLHKAPSGDPIAFLVRGAAIALRIQDAQGVEVALPD